MAFDFIKCKNGVIQVVKLLLMQLVLVWPTFTALPQPRNGYNRALRGKALQHGCNSSLDHTSDTNRKWCKLQVKLSNYTNRWETLETLGCYACSTPAPPPRPQDR
jgi:hypothetical protein